MLFPKQKTQKKRMKHPKSIIHDNPNRECFLCALMRDDHRQKRPLHKHHAFGGPNRKHSEEYGLTVDLCLEDHETGPFAVHSCKETNDLIHKIAQRKFEEKYGHEKFMEVFGRNYLEE